MSMRDDYDFLLDEEDYKEEEKLICYRDQLPSIILYKKDYDLIIRLLKKEGFDVLVEVIEKQLSNFKFVDEDAPEEFREEYELEFGQEDSGFPF